MNPLEATKVFFGSSFLFFLLSFAGYETDGKRKDRRREKSDKTRRRKGFPYEWSAVVIMRTKRPDERKRFSRLAACTRMSRAGDLIAVSLLLL